MQLILVGLSHLRFTFNRLSVTMCHLASSVDESTINLPYAGTMRG